MMAHKIDGFSAREIKELTQEMLAYAAVRDEAHPCQQDFRNALDEIMRNKKLFESSWKSFIKEHVKNNALSMASLSISALSLIMQYTHHYSKSKPYSMYPEGIGSQVAGYAQALQDTRNKDRATYPDYLFSLS